MEDKKYADWAQDIQNNESVTPSTVLTGSNAGTPNQGVGFNTTSLLKNLITGLSSVANATGSNTKIVLESTTLKKSSLTQDMTYISDNINSVIDVYESFADTNYIVMIDPDDVSKPNALKKLLAPDLIDYLNSRVELASTTQVVGLDTSLSGKLEKAGGTMTGNLILNADPTNALGAVTKQYADSLVTGLLDDRGNYDSSSNLWPSSGGSGTAGAILKGDIWKISVAGTLGGSAVSVGDWIRALIDTPGQTAANWAVVEGNIGYVPENQANKSTSTSLGTSDTLYPSQNAVKSYVDAGLALKGDLVSDNIWDGSQEFNSTTQFYDTATFVGAVEVNSVNNSAAANMTFTAGVGYKFNFLNQIQVDSITSLTAATDLNLTATANVVVLTDFYINGKIGNRSLTGNLDLYPGTDGSGDIRVFGVNLQVDKIIARTTNSDLTLSPDGTGALQVTKRAIFATDVTMTAGTFRANNINSVSGGTSLSIAAGTVINLLNDTKVDNISAYSASAITMSSIVRKTVQPCVSAYTSSALTNVTGDGTAYTLVTNQELVDQGGNYASGILTIPITSNAFMLSGAVALSGLNSSHTSLLIELVTTGRVWQIVALNPGAIRDSSNNLIVPLPATLFPASATNTASLRITVLGSTKTVGILAASSGTQTGFLQFNLLN
jgi:hypothetical protein